MTVDRSWRTALVGVVVSLLLGALLAAVLGYPVIDMFSALWRSAVVKPGRFEATLANAVPLMLTALSAAIAFAAGPVNLGQPGQLLVGALFAVTGGLYLDLPSILQVPVLLALGGLGGALWAGIADRSYFYFVHSFFAQPGNSEMSVGVTEYGLRFTCAVASDNIFATQFHPEKSASLGLRLYANFIEWRP